MSLIAKLKKNSTIKESSVLSESKFYDSKDMIPTRIPMLNVALSGSLDGGLTPGFTMVAGPSKHFKTNFALVMASAYLNKYEDAVILFYDSEFGTPQGYFERNGISLDRVMHTPITDVEILKHDIMSQLLKIERGEHVLIMIDSLGNLASKKEVDDAVDGKSVADMTRAKQLKSLFRMVTPHLNLKDIPLIAVNHTYKEIGLYPKDIVGGGTGAYYSADNIWIVGRSQEKEKIEGKEELVGYSFNIKIEKSRYAREGSRIPITVRFDGGIDIYSGLWDVALEGGFIKEATKGFYTCGSDKKFRRSELEADESIWEAFLEDAEFKAFIEKTYKA